VGSPAADMTRVDPAFAARWYDEWISAWNERKPEMIPGLVTEDFLLDSPTTRHTGWHVQGQAAAADYLRSCGCCWTTSRWPGGSPPPT
jgi:hypothetical protein